MALGVLVIVAEAVTVAVRVGVLVVVAEAVMVAVRVGVAVSVGTTTISVVGGMRVDVAGIAVGCGVGVGLGAKPPPFKTNHPIVRMSSADAPPMTLGISHDVRLGGGAPSG